MSETTILTPQYLDIDYDTMKTQLQTQLEASEIFKDYNFEGSNISLLMELVCYLGALNTYYLNKIAKNQYIDTADIYETVHMLARLRGYNPQGYRSAATTLTVSIDASAGASPGDTIYVSAWKQITAPELEDSNGDELKFSTVGETTYTLEDDVTFPYTFSVDVRQGIVTQYTYTGEDLIDYVLYLPFENFDYDDDIEEAVTPSIQVQIGSDIWTRVADFYDELSGLYTEDKVYMFRYDKYQKYIIEFSPSRQTPATTDTIIVTVLKSEGSDSSAATGTITEPETQFIYNRSTETWLDNDYVTVTNASATTGASGPETISEIKDASTGALHSQYRNVTSYDYISHLEARSDVVVANVWGEQEIAPSGSILEYNKVHISVIPDEWGTGTISTSAASASIDVATEYNDDWKTLLSIYLEPRKMISTYEQFDLPDLVYFKFDMGIRVKRTYSYDLVEADVRDKLIYYFQAKNREFNETISFLDIQDYILDSTEVSDDGETWEQVKGIRNLVIRNIDILTHDTYEPNTIGEYPQYTVAVTTYTGENQLRKITLGNNQFPVLAIDYCTFSEET